MVFFSGCSQNEKQKKPLILVSIPPYKYFVEKIVGDHFRVESIVPSGVDSHTFEPKPKQMQSYFAAKIWFGIGDPYEKKLKASLQYHNQNLLIYDLGDTVKLMNYDNHTIEISDHHHHHDHSNVDIHFWMSPPLVIQQAAFITNIIASQDPEHASDYRKNLESFTKEIDDLNIEIQDLLHSLKYRTFLTSHPSFGYFCQEYNLEQISLEIEGKEALAREINRITSLAKTKNVKVVLIEPQFSSKSARIIAKKLNLPVKMVDPYSEEYKKSLLHLAKTLRDPS